MATTFTKRDLFTNLLSLIETGTCEADFETLKDGLNHELELLDKKASTPRKPTATQVENESLKAELLSFLVAEDKPMTIKEIQEECSTFAALSNQRISHLLSALVNEQRVDKSYIKKTPFFCAK